MIKDMNEKIKNRTKEVKGLCSKVFDCLRKNAILIFVVSLISFTIVQLGTAGFLKITMIIAQRLGGMDYIAANNALYYILHPLVLLATVIYIVVLVNLIVFQIGMFVYVFEESGKGKRADIRKMIDFGFASIKKLVKPRNYFIYIIVLIVLPFADQFRISYFNISLVVPGFIMDVIKSKLYFSIPYYTVAAVVSFFAITSCFSFHYFLLEDISFFEACKKSIRHFNKNVKNIIFVNIAVDLIVAIVFFISSIILVLVTALARGSMFDIDSFFSLIYETIESIYIFASLPLLFSGIGVLFHSNNQDTENLEMEIEPLSKKKLIIRNISSITLIVIFAISDILLNIPNYGVYTTASSTPITIAHRGSSLEAPENSIPAFKLAMEQGADMIEIDIHQTKDGVLIVSHDDNLLRIAGINKHVYDLTYEEISKLDVGSWYSKEYKDLRIATLEEVLELTKGKIDLIIEIKPTQYDDHLEEKLIELIYKYDMKDQIVIHSLKDAPLKRLYELDPTLNIAYCMFLAIGDIQTIEWASIYTVEESNITPELVRKVHESGKEIYAWTINGRDNVQYLIDCGVDGFIGDDVKMLNEAKSDSLYNSGFQKFLRMMSLERLVM